ncbi:FISUMP domain-containing protein, partial [uncultured Fibrobacter sp.]|uniref:FISUMP domain-containing protein n=1 Tax=uncultured Fibrobacter sp. TaxID=261512 RepID=UPI00262061C0
VKGLGFLWVAVLAAFFALSACDDSSSASSNGPDENAAAESSSSSVCKDCEDGDGSSSSKKIESSDNQSRDSSSDEKSNSSSSKKENTNNSSSSQKAGSSSSEFVFKLCEDGDTSSIVLAGKIYYNSCKNGQWNQDSIGEYVKPKVYPNMDSVFGTLATFGTYTDQRDDKIYKTVKYRSAVSNDSFTVMAQNLNYAEIMIDSTTTVFDDSKVEKRCYKDDPWYCDNYFGARYTWSEAMGLPKVCDSVGVEENPKCNIDLSKKVQGVCPTGWHVMTETEWKHMATSNGYSAEWSVLSKAVWNYELVSEVQNSRGLSVLPKGDEYPSNQLASFWLPKEASETSGGSIHLALKYVEIGKDMKIGFFNIRCVQDEGDSF